MRSYILLLAIITASLTGCANTPAFDTQGVSQQLTPMQVSKSPEQASGKNVIWGGVILSIGNFTNYTQLEVLAYPLNANQRPEIDEPPIGRFILKKAGYLESAEYSVGRYITVRGNISGTEKGKIGQEEYIYPLVEAGQLYLWSKNFMTEQPRVHFGIGVIYGR